MMLKKNVCWNCKHISDSSSLFCEKCKVIQEPTDTNPFDLIGIKKEVEIDLQDLENRFLKLQTLVHPDKFINSSEKERILSHLQSSKMNEAYNKLQDNVERIKSLLDFYGLKNLEDNKSFDDKEILAEIMDFQNECLLAESLEERQKIVKKLDIEIDNILKDISKFFKSKQLIEAHKFNIKLSYLEKMKNNLKEGNYQ